MNDELKSHFLYLLDTAINQAELVIDSAQSKGETWLVEDMGDVINKFKKIKQAVINSTLPASNGAGLGVTRALSEMDVPSDLYNAGNDVEEFFIKQWNW